MADSILRTLCFVRHGETPLHERVNRFCGDLDPPLNERGREQAGEAREKLKRIMPQIDAAWMSPRLRARQTAEILGPQASWKIIDELRELSFGRWEGLTKEEASALTPEAYGAWEQDAYLNSPPGGESGQQAQGRIESVIARIDRAQARNILVVSHITYLRLFLSLLLDIPPGMARKHLEIQTAGIGLIEIQQRLGKLKALNL